ncbi:hypothetical protein AVEN_159106-1 [Araneus ventricosus]|uniref:Uncharacterized protein n=1 Tax=Araneus ventricosus TaxID=182803 RepID=A0A4Y2B7Z7_ARAVE|nr:hypothetical protein AVEN_159106-1 [Araneus ventricosus]
MKRMTPKLAPLFKLSYHTSERTFVLLRMISRIAGPHTRRIFSGIIFGAYNPPNPKPSPSQIAKKVAERLPFHFPQAVRGGIFAQTVSETIPAMFT